MPINPKELKAIFPWLGTDQEVSGSDVVDQLSELYTMAPKRPAGRRGGRTTIDQMTDAELAQMVRGSIYANGTEFGHGKRSARFLLVLAVPYGPDDNVTTLSEACESFARLLQDEDWKERSLQVYDHYRRPHARYSQPCIEETTPDQKGGRQ